MGRKEDIFDLSRSEYDILRVLWRAGKATVREVHDDLEKTSGWAYTTTKTMMDRMVTKTLLKREPFHGIYLYTPQISKPQGLAKMVQFFADRVVELEVESVVSLFTQGDAITEKEIEELELILEREKGEKHD